MQKYEKLRKSVKFGYRYTPFLLKSRINPWYKHREMPEMPEESFKEWYKRMLKMGSREEILSRIAKVKPEGNELPEDLSFIPGTGNLLESFVQTARNNGSQVTFVENTDGY